jgi:hypothetical protein
MVTELDRFISRALHISSAATKLREQFIDKVYFYRDVKTLRFERFEPDDLAEREDKRRRNRKTEVPVLAAKVMYSQISTDGFRLS